jgi:hypothetical protein
MNRQQIDELALKAERGRMALGIPTNIGLFAERERERIGSEEAILLAALQADIALKLAALKIERRRNANNLVASIAVGKVHGGNRPLDR